MGAGMSVNCELSAAVEGQRSEICHGVRNGHKGQSGAALERQSPDAFHTGGYDHLFDRLVSSKRRRSGICPFVICHFPCAADGQCSRIIQCPRQVLSAFAE